MKSSIKDNNERKGVRRDLEKSEMLALEYLVGKFLKENKIATGTPIKEIAEKLEFDVRYCRLKKYDANTVIDGFLVVDETKESVLDSKKSKVIVINSDHTEKYNNFVLAHELSHYIFEKSTKENQKVTVAEMRTAHKLVERSYFEKVIDYMAAALLIPKADFTKELENARKDDISENVFVNQMSEKYSVIEETITKRIKELE